MRKKEPAVPASIGAAINRVLEQFGLTEKIRQYSAVDIWPRAVGERIAKMTVAEKIADGKLFVKVSNSVWRNELVFLKKDLISKLNKMLRQNIVKDIVFK